MKTSTIIVTVADLNAQEVASAPPALKRALLLALGWKSASPWAAPRARQVWS